MYTAIAVAGAGYWAENYLKTWTRCRDENPASMAGVDLLIAGSVPNYCFKGSARLAEAYGFETVSWEAIINNQNIKGIVIATDASTHASIAHAALTAGKHVLCEKPVTLFWTNCYCCNRPQTPLP